MEARVAGVPSPVSFIASESSPLRDVDVMVSAVLPSRWFLVLRAPDRERAEAHLRSKLAAKVSESADPEDGDGLPTACPGFHRGTSSPTASMTPAIPCPGTLG